MQIYPAIDLKNGQCVRLYQGKFDQLTTYNNDPLQVAHEFMQQGANWLHMVDLDGAKDPEKNQTLLLTQLIQKLTLNIQVGGGIRKQEQIKQLLDLGVARVIVGSKAIQAPEEVKQWLHIFGCDKLVLALDVFPVEGKYFIATHGWQTTTQTTLTDLLNYYSSNLTHVLCTDISRDGTLAGPNLMLYQNLIHTYPAIQLQASGGISALTDLQALRNLSIAGTIVGRALYEKKFNLREAIAC